MEAIVGALVAVIAVIGLAHTFGLGRSMVDRYKVSRVALGVAQSRMERIGTLPLVSPDLATGTHPASPIPFVVDGVTLGEEWWTVEPVDDPDIPGPTNLRRVTVLVRFTHSSMADTIRLQRMVQMP